MRDNLRGFGAQGSDDRYRACGLGHRENHLLEILLVGQQRFAIQSEHDIFAFFHVGQRYGFLQPVVIEAQRIHQDITNHIGLRLFRLLAGSDTRAADTSGEEVVGECIDHQTVDLFRHVNIKGSRASH